MREGWGIDDDELEDVVVVDGPPTPGPAAALEPRLCAD